MKKFLKKLSSMPTPFHYMEAAFMGAAFSDRTNSYYSNTRTEAWLSCLVLVFVALYVTMTWCGFTYCRYLTGERFVESYLSHLSAVVVIALPKFVIFFSLVWLLCKFMKQTDYFCAFVAANNWTYVVYILLYSAKMLLGTYVDVAHPILFVYATSFYFSMVVFFLAHNVLRLEGEVAWLAALAIFATHGLVKWITTKNGMFLVF